MPRIESTPLQETIIESTADGYNESFDQLGSTTYYVDTSATTNVTPWRPRMSDNAKAWTAWSPNYSSCPIWHSPEGLTIDWAWECTGYAEKNDGYWPDQDLQIDGTKVIDNIIVGDTYSQTNVSPTDIDIYNTTGGWTAVHYTMEVTIDQSKSTTISTDDIRK